MTRKLAKMPKLARKKNFASTLDFLLGAGLGVAFFILVYGVSTLDVTYDSWIYCGYIEGDIIQRYAGWLYFRNSPWDWPLTVASNLSIPQGASITFTDSVPLVAILCKVFQPILPETFQYIGWYNLLNCALQGGFGMLLLRHFKLSRPLALFSSLFFIGMPIFVERLFRHDGLASQWLILAALLLYFRARGRERFPFIGFLALCMLAPTITTYFAPMIYALLAAALLEYGFAHRKLIKPVLYLGGCFAGTLVVSYVIGLLTRGGDGWAFGYGTYSFNLNALWNPTSLDWYAESGALDWSRILPILPQEHHQYDGFNYLGVGVLLGLGAMLVVGMVRVAGALFCKDTAFLKRFTAFIKSHIWLILICSCLTVFSISHVVRYNADVLLTIPLPGRIEQLCGIFRASGRMFWPCAYLLVLSLLVWCAQFLKKQWRAIAIVALAAVQLFDLWGVMARKHQDFLTQPLVCEDEFSSEGWVFLAQNHEYVYCLGNLFDYSLAAGIIRYNPDVQTNMVLTNRGNFDYITATYEPMIESLRNGEALPDNAMYLCSDEETFLYILEGLHENARGYKIGHYYAFANQLPGCPLPEYQRMGT